MKRSFTRLFTIAAFLAFGASAFAQLAFNGYYRVGGVYDSDSSTYYSSAADKLLTLSDRIRLNISFAAPDDMYGFKSRLQADQAISSTGSATSAIANLFTDSATTTAATSGSKTTYTTTNAWSNWKFAEGYAKFLDGMVKLTAGRLDVTDYMVTQSVTNIYLGNVFTDEPSVAYGSILGGQKGNTTGALLQTWPIENLSAAVMVRTDGSQEYKTHHYGLDAYYMVPGIGKALFASNLGYYAASTNAMEKLDKSFASLGFSYTGYPGLTATVAYRYNGYVLNGDGDYKAAHGAIAVVEYSAGPLFADLAGDFDLTNSHRYFEGEVAYAIIPQVKVRGYFGYTESTTTNTNIIKLNGSSMANNSLMGADIVLPVGKAEASLGLAYADKAKIQIPLIVKANF